MSLPRVATKQAREQQKAYRELREMIKSFVSGGGAGDVYAWFFRQARSQHFCLQGATSFNSRSGSLSIISRRLLQISSPSSFRLLRQSFISLSNAICGFVEFRELPLPEVGDIAILRDVGAYGATMSSNYNTLRLAPEVMLDAGTLSVIRKVQPIEQLLDLEADGGPLTY